MKVVLLAGGMGTRLAEYTEARPKPMVEIGGRPILWYLMKHYTHYGFSEFVVCARLQGRHDQAIFFSTTTASREASARVDQSTDASPIGTTNTEDWNKSISSTPAKRR